MWRYAELGDALLPLVNPAMLGKYGLEITSFVLENVSVPPEVEQAIDKRSSMSVVGNLNDYVKYQMGLAMSQGGEAGAAAAVPAQMAMGFGLAQEMVRGMQSGAPGASAPPVPPATATAPRLEVLTPEQAAQLLGVSVEDVMASITADELKARKIGSAWRIGKGALVEFLRGRHQSVGTPLLPFPHFPYFSPCPTTLTPKKINHGGCLPTRNRRQTPVPGMRR